VLLATYRPDIAQELVALSAPPFRHAQVLEHLLHRPMRPFTEASTLPAGLRPRLDECGSAVLEVRATRTTTDGTTKLLLEARDGSQTEAVLMPYGKRVTVCISSQVGCAVGCAFCATGRMGFDRNLTPAEIVDQLRAASVIATEAGRRITNVVYMGMGEPLLNLGAVLDSVRVLTDPHGLNLGHRSLSISTVGIPKGIVRLAREEPQVNLALSLHAADDATRALLIPEGFRHPLAEVLEAAWQHFAVTGRKVLVEYVLLSGVNDSVDDARRLAALLRGHVVAVNLLTWNPVCPDEGTATGDRTNALEETSAGLGAGAESAAQRGHERPNIKASAGSREPSGGGTSRRATRMSFQTSAPAAVQAFRGTLRAAHIEAVVRQSKGAGIEAACGQLASRPGAYATGSREDA
jgi:23S rRNA (adenine2503-C2)-methyltransferase